MAPVIYLVRHAESAHNVSKDFSHRDPPLTPLGQKQASALTSSFPGHETIAVVLASPLTRTLETTLAAFGPSLGKEFVGELGITGGARLVLDPDLQERSAEPCDTGSDRAALEKVFPNLDFSVLGEGWYAKEGRYTADDTAVSARAEAVRQKLFDLVKELEESGSGDRQNLVVVTHGVFMKFLSGDKTIDLPKAGWRAYTVAKEDGKAILRPTE